MDLSGLRTVVCILGLSVAGCGPGQAASRLLAAENQQCEATAEPLAVESAAPRLEWQLMATDSAARGVRQTAYRVIVASSLRQLNSDHGDMWDSGKVESGGTFGVVYRGKTLAAEATYFWKVMVWDDQGLAAPWSAMASWTMAPQVWTAKWIAQSGATNLTAQMPLFRRQFAVKKNLARAVMRVSALGQGEVYVNGTRVGDAELTPGWTDYRKTVRYETYDVTAMLRNGTNALGVMVGNGMYNVVRTPNRYTKLENSYGRPIVLLQMRLTYKDGSSEMVASDASWTATAGPITFSSTYGGEDYDATKEQSGWDSAGFDASEWAPVSVVNGPDGRLQAELAPAIRVMKTYESVKTTEVKPGVVVYDLGQNFAGWPAVRMQGAKDATVKIVPGELLNADGTVSQQKSSRGLQWWSYTLRGGGIEEWHPRFSYYGFRYVQIEWTSGTGKAISLTGQAVHSSAKAVGEFASSNEMLNRIHALILRAMENNTVSLFTDCPHREKLGWLEQTHLVAPGLMFNTDLQRLFAATDRNMADAQKEDGMVPTTAPQYTVFGPKNAIFDDSPEWGSASVLAPWSAYRFSGDVAELARAYPTMVRYVGFLESKAKDGIVRYGLGDWYDIGPGAPGFSKQTSLGVTATLMLYEDATAMEKIARLLGKVSDAERYATLAQLEKTAFNARFWDEANGWYDKGSQTANAMPLALGVVPEERRAKVLAHVVGDIHAHDDHVTTGEIGYPYMLRALMECGRSDVVMAILMRKDAPSYGSQLQAGATALTEAWDANPNSSQDHLMLGGAEEWFYRGLGGIDFDMSRAEKDEWITIRPRVVEDVESVRTFYGSTIGKIESDWRHEQGALALNVMIPAGATATVWVPTKNGEVATSLTEGVKLMRQENGASVYQVGSGAYHFTVK